MTPHPVIIRRLERRGDERFVYVDETIGQETVSHTLRFDDATFAELERAFAVHPFTRKPPTDDVVLFRGLSTPAGGARKFLNLQIVNGGSRYDLKIEAANEAFSAMRMVYDSWCRRFELLDEPPLPTPASDTPAGGAPVATPPGGAGR
jgi:hypothetical protein